MQVALTVRIRLAAIHKKQLRYAVALWRRNSGYLDFVLDDRNSAYWRAYVGQSSNPIQRMGQHIRCIRDCERESLHYYIIWMGAPFRSANFIRLWSIPYIAMDLPELQLICQNIIELAMCRAFQSFPPSSLTQIFGEDAGNPYTCVELNIVSPLFQGLNLQKEVCQYFTRQIKSSPDPEIRL